MAKTPGQTLGQTKGLNRGGYHPLKPINSIKRDLHTGRYRGNLFFEGLSAFAALGGSTEDQIRLLRRAVRQKFVKGPVLVAAKRKIAELETGVPAFLSGLSADGSSIDAGEFGGASDLEDGLPLNGVNLGYVAWVRQQKDRENSGQPKLNPPKPSDPGYKIPAGYEQKPSVGKQQERLPENRRKPKSVETDAEIQAASQAAKEKKFAEWLEKTACADADALKIYFWAKETSRIMRFQLPDKSYICEDGSPDICCDPWLLQDCVVVRIKERPTGAVLRKSAILEWSAPGPPPARAKQYWEVEMTMPVVCDRHTPDPNVTPGYISSVTGAFIPPRHKVPSDVDKG